MLPSAFPADKLILVEVYTPGGNWSSYPPHKHEVHNPPVEVDLDEIYYYRMKEPSAFAFQNLYSSDKARNSVLKSVMATLFWCATDIIPWWPGRGMTSII